MPPEQQQALAGYATNDVELEWKLFILLLPRLSRPEAELLLAQHCVEMTTKPVLMVDYAKAESIITRMEAKVEEAVEKVMVMYGD
jgi:hypothetical protein